MTTETRLLQRILSVQYQKGSIMMTNPGNRGERPPESHFLYEPDRLELLFEEWISMFPFKSQNGVFIEIVRLIYYKLPSHCNMIIDIVNIIKREVRSPETFSDVVWEGLAGILQVAESWGLDLNGSAIKTKYENARVSDKQRKDPQPVQVVDTDPQEFRVAEMRSSCTQTRGPFVLQGENLVDIQQAILYEVGSSGNMELPDVWYPKSDHMLTRRKLRWYLIDEGWTPEEYCPVEKSDPGPELYFVDITQSDSSSSQAVSKLCRRATSLH
ncbi:hypothetical protein CPB86DRAFT_878502 [Serendipita vermifera]|nr:hypothetical protein CPB86DRAFT_878502 [Serendipita vermifera]